MERLSNDHKDCPNQHENARFDLSFWRAIVKISVTYLCFCNLMLGIEGASPSFLFLLPRLYLRPHPGLQTLAKRKNFKFSIKIVGEGGRGWKKWGCLNFLLSELQGWYGYTLKISKIWTDRKFKIIAVSFFPWLLSFQWCEF